jgi:cytidine deaminase
MKEIYSFNYQKFASIEEVSSDFHSLMAKAKQATTNAYAPYSNFHVGAAILFNEIEIFTGFNIENASYPVGICAERSALSAVITQFPSAIINAIAISYNGLSSANNTPAFPCGMCRQFILECEVRNKKDIPLVLSGQTGEVVIIESIKDILPFYFTADSMKK